MIHNLSIFLMYCGIGLLVQSSITLATPVPLHPYGENYADCVTQCRNNFPPGAGRVVCEEFCDGLID